MVGSNGRPKADLSPQERLFATEVARARAAARVSQQWVGDQIGLSRSKVSEVCCGRYLPQREAVVLLSEALGMDRERTLRLWQDAWEANAQRRQRDRLNLRASAPLGWDRLPVLSADVVSLLRAQVRMAEELPYQLPGARPPSLSTVYVRQELGTEPEDFKPARQTPVTSPMPDDPYAGSRFGRPDTGPETTGRPTAPRLAVRAPSRPVREALDANDHVLVTAGPGHGKSTLIQRLAADIAQTWVGQDKTAETVTEGNPPLSEVVVPVRIPARVLAGRTDLPLPEALAAALSAEYGPMLTVTIGSAVFAERVAGCRWLLLIDALDEIADPEVRARLIRSLSGWASESPGQPYRLLVTSRPLENGGLAPLHRDAARYELQPFDAEALKRFANHWFDGEEDLSRRFLGQIRQAHLDELVRVPLLATIAAIIFQQHGDRPLPDNRYDLYEEYLNYLALPRRLPAETGEFSRLVRELRSPLLEHLGAARFLADVSLTAAAQGWLLANTTPYQRPAAWQNDLVALLRNVGPLVVRGDDLQFLHHSFAEHLAATARARQLPAPFDADHPDWAQAIHTAQHGRSTRHVRMVLLHYTHLRVDQADALVSWLHDNSSGFQQIAAELLSQHVPVTAAVLDAFLATARAWARTSSGTEIFRQATHATHHPRLATWLRNLLHDPETTWNCRIEAAVALCTRLNVHVHEATDLLRTAMDDVALELGDRLAAAEGLAKVGRQQHEVAVRGLRAVLDDPSRTPYMLRGAAVALADLGPTCHDEAVRILRETLADPGVSAQHQLQAAIGLAEIGAEFHPHAVATFRAIAGDTGLNAFQRVEATLALGDLRSTYLDQAADLLTGMVTDRSHRVFERCRFASALAELGPEYAGQAAGRLLTILDEPFLTPNELWRVAEELATAHPDYQEQSAARLRQVVSNLGNFSNPKLWAAKALAELGAEYHVEAARVLALLSTDPTMMEWERVDAAGKLASLGPRYRDKAVATLRQKLADQALDSEERLSAASELVALGTEFHEEVSAALYMIATDPAEDAGERVSSATKLAGLRTTFRGQAVEIIRTVLHDPGASTAARRNAAQRLVQLRPTSRAESAVALCAILHDTTREWMQRNLAARNLADLGGEHVGEAVCGLRAMLDRPPANWISFQQVATSLASFGTKTRTQAADDLRTILITPDATPERKQAAALALTVLGQKHWENAEQALYGMLSDPDARPEFRQEAADVLIRHRSRHLRHALAASRAVLADPTAAAWTRESAARTLARQGEQHLTDAIDGLRTALAEQLTPVETRAELAGTLAEMGREHRETSERSLQAMLTVPGATARGRVETAWQLMRIDAAYRVDGFAVLSEVLTDSSAPTNDRCTAATYLMQLDQNHAQLVIPVLLTMLTSPLAKPSDRLSVIDRLVRFGVLNRAARTELVLAVAQDRTADGSARGRAAWRLRGGDYAQRTTSLEIERDLLNDHLVPVSERITGRHDFQIHHTDAPLRNEKITALHDVINEPEFDLRDRFEAQVLLSEFD
ncbi:NACHT domain-containing protein, partial [Amycolatopsis lurida]|uniref:NACHT domain-containing protein n=1 Tax=Amycolatopsis lurida TaxID=31959 RepID=UPI0036561050